MRDISKVKNDDKIVTTLRDRGWDIKQVTSASKVGKGFYNVVYTVDNNNVLKINKGNLNLFKIKDEVDQYKKIIGKELKNVVNVKFAEFFEDIDKSVIVLEKLESIDKNHYIYTDRKIKYRSKNRDIITGLFKYYWYEYKMNSVALYDLLIDFTEAMEISFVDYINNGGETIQLLSDIYNGMNQLKDMGVKPKDVHFSNIMYDNSTSNFKIIDF